MDPYLNSIDKQFEKAREGIDQKTNSTNGKDKDSISREVDTLHECRRNYFLVGKQTKIESDLSHCLGKITKIDNLLRELRVNEGVPMPAFY